MTVADWARIGRRYWASILGLTLAGIAAGVGYAILRPDSYDARTSVVISGRAQTDGENAGQLSTYIQGMMQTFADVVTEQIVLDGVARQLNDGTSWEQLRRQIQVEVPVGSTIIHVTVTDPNPEHAARIANLIPGQLQRVIPELSTGSARGPISVTRTSEAEVPPPHGWSALPTAAGIGALIGLVLGLFVAYLRRVTALTDAPEE